MHSLILLEMRKIKALRYRINRLLSLPNSSLLDKNAPGVKLLILDRTYDLATPLLHDFHYQAMTEDLIGIDKEEGVVYNKQTNKGEEVVEKYLLNEDDSVWLGSRFLYFP